ncbi:MAG: WYL domain-containing protein [Phenylobacterium sp.]|uniref:helix-turn-helix transcriptional regulator n=1 Tax=Phenylobacterium sp. TaxID=1871053 RepID=UPI002A2C29EE|nr:WYL domain-containing protein [Phenylobacterium sp.]MCA3712375.1 WYL domain-containing protein [Phenylobacterium sp.]MCA3713908.1 WYL domain-containing protein [Phenylobacterium sp.]MCA3727109.1 WYL domain-containing protein [Phenylobacterium sp.]MCA3728523.1 WYL domain-containing protein [Phenylobacterium sp.]
MSIDALWFPGAGGEPPPRAPSRLEAAIARRLRVSFSYSDQSGFSSRRRVRPLQLVSSRNGVHLIAWCELRRDMRTFRLDRMGAVRPGSRFLVPRGWGLEGGPGVDRV